MSGTSESKDPGLASTLGKKGQRKGGGDTSGADRDTKRRSNSDKRRSSATSAESSTKSHAKIEIAVETQVR